MKALVFAAGLGTRLKPLTDLIPKALVPINGIPLLKLVVLKLKQAGVTELIINIHHKGEQIIDYVKSENYFDINIKFSDETGKLLETGGGIKYASWFFDDNQPFFVHNVDILSNINLIDLYQFHLNSNVLVTLFCTSRESSRYLLFDKNNHLKAWKNEVSGEIKPTGMLIDSLNRLSFNGIHVISPQLFQHMNGWEGKFSIIDFYLSIAHLFPISAYAPSGIEMIDVGKIASLDKASELAERFY